MEKMHLHLKKQAQEIAEFLASDALEVIAVEGINQIEETYQNEGFTDAVLEKWQPRKTTDKRARDLTRYRTNKKGTAGNLTKFGRQNKGRKVLTGHGSGGDKLRNSWRESIGNGKVKFQTDKAYAKRHNEGLEGMPKRKQVGRSKKTDAKIKGKIDTEITKIIKR